jgi:hypothetical protein
VKGGVGGGEFGLPTTWGKTRPLGKELHRLFPIRSTSFIGCAQDQGCSISPDWSQAPAKDKPPILVTSGQLI